MKTSFKTILAALLALAAGAGLVPGAEPTLKVGDMAPRLQVGKWVQGEPVKDFEPGKAYIIEFWATWCGPCKEAIPHLNETWLKYKDKNLVVIGQDCSEEDESLVEPFIKKMEGKMTYRVALDNKVNSKNGKMNDTWMDAAGQDGIPTAFLVDTKGLLAWIGHPMELKESVIEDVLAGKFDVQKAAADYAEKKKSEAQLSKLGDELESAMQDKNWEVATAKVAEMQKLMPAEEASHLDMVRFGILIGKKDYPGAYKLATQISDDHKDDVRLQDQLAWGIATDPTIEKADRNLDVAETIANRANDAAKGQDLSVLDTLGRLKFLRGKKDEAVAFAEKALKLATADQKEELQATLDAYKKGELPKGN